MNLDKLMLKIVILEGLAVALNKLIDYDVEVIPDCRDSFNAVCALAEVLKDRSKEIRQEVNKYV